MKDIETVTLELTPYESVNLRHAILELSGLLQDGETSKAIEIIDEALNNVGITFLFPHKAEKGKIIHD